MSVTNTMNICFFGSYSKQYSRNKILIDGLVKNHVRVFHCQSKQGLFINRYIDLARQYFLIFRQIDILFVAFVGHLDMPLAWLLARLTGKKVVFDMFYSMYDTFIFDRKVASSKSLRAKSFIVIDKIAGSLADAITTDTTSHARYFVKLFRLRSEKFHRIFVGGDNTVFKPIKRSKKNKVIVEFHGMFTLLQGAEYFIKAAKKMENKKNIEFWLIGSSSHYKIPLELLNNLKPKNLKYFSDLPVKDLAQKIAQADISIGHLGTSIKSKNVITNKIFHALAVRNAVIAGDCVASRELLEDNKTAFFVSMGDPDELVKKIKYVINNRALRKKVAENGYLLTQQKLSNKILGKQLLKVFTEVLN